MAGSPLKTVTLCYYAAFREAAGVREEPWSSGARTAAELYAEIAARRGFRFDRSTLKVAVNDQVVSWETAVTDGDTVVFLAPFAGG